MVNIYYFQRNQIFYRSMFGVSSSTGEGEGFLLGCWPLVKIAQCLCCCSEDTPVISKEIRNDMAKAKRPPQAACIEVCRR